MEETDIFLALMRGQLLCIGNGVRNDSSIFTFRSKNISMQGSNGEREKKGQRHKADVVNAS